MPYYPQNSTGLNYITYPAGPTAGSATVITAHASANTKGSYAEITASSSFTCNQVSLNMYGGSGGNGLRYLVDLATGAGGAESVLIPDTGAFIDNNAGMQPKAKPFLTYIAASTRLAARASCNINDATDRVFDMALIAGIAPTESGGAGAGGSYAFC